MPAFALCLYCIFGLPKHRCAFGDAPLLQGAYDLALISCHAHVSAYSVVASASDAEQTATKCPFPVLLLENLPPSVFFGLMLPPWVTDFLVAWLLLSPAR